MTGHTANRCDKLHGYPPGHKFYNKPKPSTAMANQVNFDDPSEEARKEKVSFTKMQYHELLALLKIRESSPTPHSANQIQVIPSIDPTHSSTMSGTIYCFTAHQPTSAHTTLWIIDTGATDHMVCHISFFTSITTIVSHSVRLPNGEIAAVTHIGVVKVTDSILLSHVLCVPSINFNLLSA